MEVNRRDPREDIFLIRQVLERAADGMRALAPWFIGLGLVWLAYGAFTSVIRVIQPRVSVSAAGKLAVAGTLAGWGFYLVLAGGFLVCRSRHIRQGLDTLAKKLVDMWGICSVIFLALVLLLSVILPSLAVWLLSLSAEAAQPLIRALALCRGFLFYLMPVAPLLTTAAFLDDKRMLRLGILLAILAGAVLSCHAIMLFGDFREGIAVGPGVEWAWNGAACLLDLAPAIMLLAFGLQLKRR